MAGKTVVAGREVSSEIGVVRTCSCYTVTFAGAGGPREGVSCPGGVYHRAVTLKGRSPPSTRTSRRPGLARVSSPERVPEAGVPWRRDQAGREQPETPAAASPARARSPRRVSRSHRRAGDAVQGGSEKHVTATRGGVGGRPRGCDTHGSVSAGRKDGPALGHPLPGGVARAAEGGAPSGQRSGRGKGHHARLVRVNTSLRGERRRGVGCEPAHWPEERVTAGAGTVTPGKPRDCRRLEALGTGGSLSGARPDGSASTGPAPPLWQGTRGSTGHHTSRQRPRLRSH